jgi:hypothetical protein
MTISVWIDNDHHGLKLGHVGYLVETLNTATGKACWSVRDRPLRTNRSNELRLRGFCGETNNHSRTAHGVVIVAEVNGSMSRARIASVVGAHLAEFLRSDGYPELVPDEPSTTSTPASTGGA